MKCRFCEELETESNTVYVGQIVVDNENYKYHIPIRYCPNCGKRIEYHSNPLRRMKVERKDNE